MRHTLATIALAAAILLPVSAGAEQISVQQAKSIATGFLTQATQKGAGVSAAPDVRLMRTESTPQGRPVVYLFDDASTRSFVVVSADDDAAEMVLGYGDNDFSDASAMPPALKYWLGEYARQITAMEGANYPKGSIHRPVIEAVELPDEVAPLLGDLAWNQESPFNGYCPQVNGKLCVTGCVATSTAQAMRYWQYPMQGKGSWSYTWNDSTLTKDFSQSVYDWSQMPYRYNSTSTAEQNAQVAKLMNDVGVAVSMDYGTSESGALTTSCVYALVNNFGYDKGMQVRERSMYGIALWENTLRTELAAGRPVIYAGQSSEGGHQFVCDGYDTRGYFHFNWGWGGMCNGYFLTTALVPEGVGVGGFAAGYNFNQSIITGIQPNRGNDASYALTGFADSFYASNSRNYTLAAYGYSFVPGSASIDLGFFIADSATPVVDASRVHKSKSVTVTPTIPGRSSGQISPVMLASGTTTFDPVSEFSLADGTYYISPVYKPSTAENWEQLPSGTSQYVTLVVQGGVGSVISETGKYLKVNSLDVPKTVYPGRTVAIKANVEAEGGEFYNSMTLMLNSQAGDTIAVAGSALVDILPGVPTDVTLELTVPVSTVPGTYSAQFIVAQQNVGSPVTVDVVSGAVALTKTNFPDATLLSLLKTYDTDSDGSLSDSELNSITLLNAMSKGITNATGIGNLYALVQLYLDGNSISDIDVSPLQNLAVLGLDQNHLTSLDVSANTKLQYLRCADNMIQTLDVSDLTMLDYLDISYNPILAIDLGLAEAIETFSSESHSAVSLDPDGVYDLIDVPGLDVSRMHNISGATLDGTNLRFDSSNASYLYDTGNTTLPYMPVNLVAVNYTGVDAATATDGEPTACYDFQGRSVKSPTTGIYIIRRGAETQKAVIR